MGSHTINNEVSWEAAIKAGVLLSSRFFERDTELVAQDLLGKVVVRQDEGVVIAGLIVETEAYTGDDPACHAYRGKTKSNASLFGNVGHAYVYFTYGMHFCCNVVARSPQEPSGGVLLRALQPLVGIEFMQQYRRVSTLIDLTNGPGKLSQALRITRALDGVSLMQSGPLYLLDIGYALSPNHIVSGPRIGISKAKEMHRRFYVLHNPYVSRLTKPV